MTVLIIILMIIIVVSSICLINHSSYCYCYYFHCYSIVIIRGRAWGPTRDPEWVLCSSFHAANPPSLAPELL